MLIIIIIIIFNIIISNILIIIIIMMIIIIDLDVILLSFAHRPYHHYQTYKDNFPKNIYTD